MGKEQQCSYRSLPRGRMAMHLVQCRNRAKVTRSGVSFCLVHDPVAVKKRRKMRERAWQDKNRERDQRKEADREALREEGRQEVRQEVRLVLSLSELGEEQPALPDWAEKMLCAEVAKDRYGEGTAPACGEERATDA